DLLDLAAQVHLLDVLHAQVGAETLRLVAHFVHQLWALDALGEAREVLHLGGLHQQAAEVHALEDDRLKLGAGGVDRGGVAGWPGAHDDHVVDLLRRVVGTAGAGGGIGSIGRGGRVRVIVRLVLFYSDVGLQGGLRHVTSLVFFALGFAFLTNFIQPPSPGIYSQLRGGRHSWRARGGPAAGVAPASSGISRCRARRRASRRSRRWSSRTSRAARRSAGTESGCWPTRCAGQR